jgi:hypothetical protein
MSKDKKPIPIRKDLDTLDWTQPIPLSEKLKERSLADIFKDYQYALVEETFIEVDDALEDINEALASAKPLTVRHIAILQSSVGGAMTCLIDLSHDLEALEQQVK